MNDPNTLELAHLPIAKMQDVLLARFVGCSEATRLGFAAAILSRIATAVSEITRNVVQHAGATGDIRFTQLTADHRTGLRITVADTGIGMENPQQYLANGRYATIGAGLPGTKALADFFAIHSVPRAGTTVTMEFWEKALPLPAGS